MSKTSIWARLKAKGFSDYACAAIMGNMQQESAFRPNNVEDRYHRDTGNSDEYYTAAVDNGSYTRSDFMRDGGKAYGFGLCQWTYFSRKAGIYDFAKQRGVSIADEQMQIDWLWEELHQGEYRQVLDVLMSGASLYDMTARFMCVYENPADKSDGAISYRYRLASEIYEEFEGSNPAVPDDGNQEPPETQEADTPTTPFWPPRMLCCGMVGSDVMVLQALLYAHGLNPGSASGEYDTWTRNAVVAFQSEKKLTQDGVAGQNTFRALGVNV